MPDYATGSALVHLAQASMQAALTSRMCERVTASAIFLSLLAQANVFLQSRSARQLAELQPASSTARQESFQTRLLLTVVCLHGCIVLYLVLDSVVLVLVYVAGPEGLGILKQHESDFRRLCTCCTWQTFVCSAASDPWKICCVLKSSNGS
jgi:hypothetical protein